jgi:hypothetical protein
MTDFRALCEELVQKWDTASGWDGLLTVDEIINQARTALAEEPVVPTDMNYRTAYLEIAEIVFSRFPTCEITTVDMVRMLAFENDTLRIALKLPLAKQVLSATEDEPYS